jgi:hypothetical protein
MGQPITVVRKPTTQPGVVRFELNRSLTGMGHERYSAVTEVTGHRPPDELARRVFARGGVNAVHVYSNEVTVELAPGADDAGLREAMEELFIHYTDGVTPSIP